MQGAALYLMGLGCLGLGLSIAWLQAENHARGDELQRLERRNFDLDVINRELDARLTAELQRLEAELDGARVAAPDARLAEGLQ